jgi:predicted nucleotide-binding protein
LRSGVVGIRVEQLKTKLEAFLEELQTHRDLWGKSLDRTIPDFPIRNHDELRRQSAALSRSLGGLRPYIERLEPSWVMQHPATGVTWDALEVAVGLSAVAQAKGPSFQAVEERLIQILGRLDTMPDEQMILMPGEDPAETAGPAGILTAAEAAGDGGADSAEDRDVVFVVHGRDQSLRRSLFDFLRALGLRPLEWAQAVQGTGEGAPYVGEVLGSAFARAQAVVVLLSPDDEVRLREDLCGADELTLERDTQLQARPNVLFEAGLAFGSHPNRTILVQVGPVKPFSDVGGRHVIRLDNSPERRADLAQRLETAGCPVDQSGRDWLSVGDFSTPDLVSSGAMPPAGQDAAGPDLDIRMGNLGAWKDEQILVENRGREVAQEITVLLDGKPADQHACWVSGQTLPDALRPGEVLGVKLALEMGSPERTDVTVRWKTAGGHERSAERLVQLL